MPLGSRAITLAGHWWRSNSGRTELELAIHGAVAMTSRRTTHHPFITNRMSRVRRNPLGTDSAYLLFDSSQGARHFCRAHFPLTSATQVTLAVVDREIETASIGREGYSEGWSRRIVEAHKEAWAAGRNGNVSWMRLGIVHQRIHRGAPQENGAHERAPDAQTAGGQPMQRTCTAHQRQFDAFRLESNTERPHNALGGDMPRRATPPRRVRTPSGCRGPNTWGISW